MKQFLVNQLVLPLRVTIGVLQQETPQSLLSETSQSLLIVSSLIQPSIITFDASTLIIVVLKHQMSQSLYCIYIIYYDLTVHNVACDNYYFSVM